MIEEQAIVTRREDGKVWLRATQDSACGACSQQEGCATATLSKAMPRREFAVDDDINLQVGDRVRVGIDTGHLLLGSFLMYIFPLVVMLVVAVLADRFLPNSTSQLWLLLISLTGLMLGFGLLKCLDFSLLSRGRIQAQISGNRFEGVCKISYRSHDAKR